MRAKHRARGSSRGIDQSPQTRARPRGPVPNSIEALHRVRMCIATSRYAGSLSAGELLAHGTVATPRTAWSPTLSDYLYSSLTSAIAVRPTDTMPPTRRVKGLMAIESLVSYAVVILVIGPGGERPGHL